MRTNSGRAIAVRHLDNSYRANDLTDKEIESAWEATYSGDGHLFWRGCETTPGDRRHRIAQHADNRRLHSVPDVAWSTTRYCCPSTPPQWVHTGWGLRYCLPSSFYCWVDSSTWRQTTCVSNVERGHWQKKLASFGKAEETQIKQTLLIRP